MTNVTGSTFNVSGVVLGLAQRHECLPRRRSISAAGRPRTCPTPATSTGRASRSRAASRSSLPDATSYVERRTSAFLNDYLTASGTNSKLDLSSVTTISGSTGAFATLTISASSGGYVDLHNLTSLTGNTGAFGQLNISASNGGYVDLRNLPTYTTGTVQVLASGSQ